MTGTSDTRDRLAEVRDIIRATIDLAAPSNVAGLVKEYRNVLAAIDALPAQPGPSELDALTARRAERLAAMSPI